MSTMLDKLIKLQNQEGMSNRQFAEKLGISTQLWQATRTGKRPIGLMLIKAIMRAYPKLRFDVFVFLCRECYEMPAHSLSHDISSEDYQTLRQRFLAAYRHLIVSIYTLLRKLTI